MEKIEYAIENRGTIRDILAWGKKEVRIEESLEKKGYKTLFCVQEDKEGQTRSIKIMESKGLYILMVDSKAKHSSRSLDDCMKWGRTAGYLKEDEVRKETRKKKPATTEPKQTAPQPVNATQKKIKADNSWSISSYGGWRL